MSKIIKSKDIDFTRVSEFEYDLEKYYRDVPFLKVARKYIKLNHLRDKIYDANIIVDGNEKYLRINAERNNCLLDFVNIDVETLVNILETQSMKTNRDIKVNQIIKDITKIDLEDFICHVYYEGGGEDFIKLD